MIDLALDVRGGRVRGSVENRAGTDIWIKWPNGFRMPVAINGRGEFLTLALPRGQYAIGPAGGQTASVTVGEGETTTVSLTR